MIATMLIGMPASGKSTWVKQLPGYYRDLNTWGGGSGERFVGSAQVHSSDDYIEQIAGKFGMTYDLAFKDLIGFADKLYWQGIEADIRNCRDMILDRTHLSLKSRAKAMQKLREAGYIIDAVVFPLPSPDVWEFRLSSRPGKTIPKNVIESMHKSYVPPHPDEGFRIITEL